MLCQAPWVGGEARAPGNRQLDTGFEEGRRPSERRACRGEGLGVRPCLPNLQARGLGRRGAGVAPCPCALKGARFRAGRVSEI